MKIYTRTGDSGTTSLVGGRRISKADPRLDAYGTVDELNSHLGVLAAIPAPSEDRLTLTDRELLARVQNHLFDLGAYLATDPDDLADGPETVPAGITPEAITELERAIDALDPELPPLRSFILPGGTPQAAQANVARTVCRRAERAMTAIPLYNGIAAVHPLAMGYMNRLSDYLFALGRALNARAGRPDIPWTPNR